MMSGPRQFFVTLRRPAYRREALLPGQGPEPLSNVAGSAINPQYPVFGNPTTASVRANFLYAKGEIEDLQARVVDAEAAIEAGGPGGIGEAPNDGRMYVRQNRQWVLLPDGVTPPVGGNWDTLMWDQGNWS